MADKEQLSKVEREFLKNELKSKDAKIKCLSEMLNMKYAEDEDMIKSIELVSNMSEKMNEDNAEMVERFEDIKLFLDNHFKNHYTCFEIYDTNKINSNITHNTRIINQWLMIPNEYPLIVMKPTFNRCPITGKGYVEKMVVYNQKDGCGNLMDSYEYDTFSQLIIFYTDKPFEGEPEEVGTAHFMATYQYDTDYSPENNCYVDNIGFNDPDKDLDMGGRQAYYPHSFNKKVKLKKLFNDSKNYDKLISTETVEIVKLIKKNAGDLRMKLDRTFGWETNDDVSFHYPYNDFYKKVINLTFKMTDTIIDIIKVLQYINERHCGEDITYHIYKEFFHSYNSDTSEEEMYYEDTDEEEDNTAGARRHFQFDGERPLMKYTKYLFEDNFTEAQKDELINNFIKSGVNLCEDLQKYKFIDGDKYIIFKTILNDKNWFNMFRCIYTDYWGILLDEMNEPYLDVCNNHTRNYESGLSTDINFLNWDEDMKWILKYIIKSFDKFGNLIVKIADKGCKTEALFMFEYQMYCLMNNIEIDKNIEKDFKDSRVIETDELVDEYVDFEGFYPSEEKFKYSKKSIEDKIYYKC